MKKTRFQSFILIVLLIALTGAALAYSSAKGKPPVSNHFPTIPHRKPSPQEIVKISGNLVQDKVLQGSDGMFNLSLTLNALNIQKPEKTAGHHVDMVIVLDRSGSMKGKKIEYARQAILNLLSKLAENDRMALIAYSDSVHNYSGLLNVSNINRRHLKSIIRRIQAGGATNLGSGLQEGINTLLSRIRNGNAGKVILISDGHANRGVTDPQDLGRMASVAIEKEFSVSTVGVGSGFNEFLMTRIADRGTGTYYYLENPSAFAEVFEKEFYDSKATIVGGVSVHIPASDGISLLDAAGYPIQVKNGHAVFHPGNLQSGQTRRLFLTLRVPSHAERKFEINNIGVSYIHGGQLFETRLAQSFQIACVKNRQEVYSSIDKETWTEKVLQEDFNRLKQEIAGDIKTGKKRSALDRMDKYYEEQKSLNATVGSAEVVENLNKDLKELRNVVEDSFNGAPEAVSRKQKLNSKSLQYEGYSGRRQK